MVQTPVGFQERILSSLVRIAHLALLEEAKSTVEETERLIDLLRYATAEDDIVDLDEELRVLKLYAGLLKNRGVSVEERPLQCPGIYLQRFSVIAPIVAALEEAAAGGEPALRLSTDRLDGGDVRVSLSGTTSQSWTLISRPGGTVELLGETSPY